MYTIADKYTYTVSLFIQAIRPCSLFVHLWTVIGDTQELGVKCKVFGATLQSLATAHSKFFVANNNAHPEIGCVGCRKVTGRGFFG